MSTENDSHPIWLEKLVFTKCVVEAMPNHIPEEGSTSVPPVNNIEVKPDPENPRHWLAIMRTVVNAERDPASPYFVDMECAAMLVSDDTLDEKTARRGVLITAHSVLYGAIRESVSWITGRQPYGSLMLGLSVLRPPPANKPAAPLPEADSHDEQK